MSDYTRLVLVDVDGSPFVVDSQGECVHQGDLVEFDEDGNFRTGECVATNFVDKRGEEYTFIALLHPIYPMKRHWRLSWDAADEENKGD